MFTSLSLYSENDDINFYKSKPATAEDGTVYAVLNFNLHYLDLPLLVQHLTIWYDVI